MYRTRQKLFSFLRFAGNWSELSTNQERELFYDYCRRFKFRPGKTHATLLPSRSSFYHQQLSLPIICLFDANTNEEK